MNELQLFSYENKGVRTVQRNGDIWWVLKDVCAVLNLTTAARVAERLDEDEVSSTHIIDSMSRPQSTTIINESGLYNVIIRSDKPEARKFKRWITHEVLPSIRHHGGYMTPEKVEEILSNPDTIIQLATQLKNEREQKKLLSAEIEKKDQLIGELQPKADYVDYILSSMGTMTAGQIAADYNLSAKRLNAILHESGLQHRIGKQWILYKKYMELGYTKSETISFKHSDGRPDTKLFTKWTQKGRLKINEILNSQGIYADIGIIDFSKASA